jgi:hypothetical protein
VDEVDTLIARCRVESVKHETLDDLLLHVADSRVVEFLLEIIVNPDANLSIRCGAIEMFEYRLPKDPAQQLNLRQALLDILAKRADSLVEPYAAAALLYHAHLPEVTAVLLPILSDPREGSVLRINILETIAGSGEWSEREPIVRGLLSDPDAAVAEHAEFKLHRRKSRKSGKRRSNG